MKEEQILPKIKRLKISENYQKDGLDIDVVDENMGHTIPVIDRIKEAGNWFELYFKDNLIGKINKTYVVSVVY